MADLTQAAQFLDTYTHITYLNNSCFYALLSMARS